MIPYNASDCDIKFNILQCQLINFSDNNNNTEFNFDAVALSAESKGTRLDHIIGVNVNNDILQDASYTLTRNVSVLHNCMHCSYFVKYKLCTSYCTSFYGCPLWDVTCKQISRFYTSWRKLVRKLFNLPYRTHHCNLLPIIAGCQPIEGQILCRTAKFIYGALSNQNTYLNLLMNLVTRGSRSAVSKTYNYILYKCKLSKNMFYNTNAFSSVRSKIMNSLICRRRGFM